MNCHGNKDNKQGEHKHKGHMSHMWMMVLCCAIPIVLLLALPLLNIKNAGWLSGAIFFLCPLMHVLMIPMMMKRNKQDKNETQDQEEIIDIEDIVKIDSNQEG